MTRRTVHVVPGDGHWAVRQDGARTAKAQAPTQRQAINLARQMASKAGGEVVIHGRDGKILERARYDPAQKTAQARQTFTAVVHKEGRWYVAECPEVGTVSQGRTVEIAVSNLQEATELYLEEFAVPEVGRALVTTFDVLHA